MLMNFVWMFQRLDLAAYSYGRYSKSIRPDECREPVTATQSGVYS